MVRNKSAFTVMQLALCLCPWPLLSAQEVGQPPQVESPNQSVFTASNANFIEGVAKVPLRLEQPVSSASGHKGDRVRLTLSKNLFDDGKLLAPAGSTVYATVSHVRAKSRHRSGEVKFSNVALDLGNGQMLRLREGDPEAKAGAGETAAYLIASGILVGPIVVALLPIQLPMLLVHDLQNRHKAGPARTAKAEPVDKELPEGEVVVYYADHKDLVRQQSSH